MGVKPALEFEGKDLVVGERVQKVCVACKVVFV